MANVERSKIFWTYFSLLLRCFIYPTPSKAFFSQTLNVCITQLIRALKLLFTKPIKRNVPVCIARLLVGWYKNHTMQVQCGTCFSYRLTVTSGARQRESCEPIVAYLRELSIQQGTARAGCTVGNVVVNQLPFADDICVFGPSLNGLQRLLNICCD